MLCDVDRTLLTHDHRLLSGVAKAAARLPIPLILATARSPTGVRRIIRAVGAMDLVICFNGAWIGDEVTGEVLNEVPLDRETALAIITAARDLGVVPAWFTLSECVAFQTDRSTVARRVRVTGDRLRLIDRDADLPGAPHKILLTVAADRADDIVGQCAAIFAGRAAVSRSGATLIEVVGPGVNKGAAGQHVAAHLDLDLAEIAAAGDSANDSEMLAWAGLSIVPANAAPGLCDRASVVVPSCDDGGIAAGFDWIAALPVR